MQSKIFRKTIEITKFEFKKIRKKSLDVRVVGRSLLGLKRRMTDARRAIKRQKIEAARQRRS